MLLKRGRDHLLQSGCYHVMSHTLSAYWHVLHYVAWTVWQCDVTPGSRTSITADNDFFQRLALISASLSPIYCKMGSHVAFHPSSSSPFNYYILPKLRIHFNLIPPPSLIPNDNR